MESVIALAIPFFFLLLAAELVAARVTGRRIHRFNDSITDLSCGVGDQVLGILTKTLTLFPYAWIYTNARIMDPSPLVAWLLAGSVSQPVPDLRGELEAAGLLVRSERRWLLGSLAVFEAGCGA